MDAIRKQQMLAGVPLKPEPREPTHEERKQQMLAQLPVDMAALAERRDPKTVKREAGALPVHAQFARQGNRLLDDLIHKASGLMNRKLEGKFITLDGLSDLLSMAKSIQSSADALVKWVTKEKKDFERRLKTERPAN